MNCVWTRCILHSNYCLANSGINILTAWAAATTLEESSNGRSEQFSIGNVSLVDSFECHPCIVYVLLSLRKCCILMNFIVDFHFYILYFSNIFHSMKFFFFLFESFSLHRNYDFTFNSLYFAFLLSKNIFFIILNQKFNYQISLFLL